MPHRIYNYCAFYVAEPFEQSNMGANVAYDFCYYNLLKAWKGADVTFPFLDAHSTTYNVRDNSNWETTLKPRLHARLRNSKNIVLFLSSHTANSKALKEEIAYGIQLGLPIIVVYPEYNNKEDIADANGLKQCVKNLWDKLPILRDNIANVPTIHIPMNKDIMRKVLTDKDLMVQTKNKNGCWYFS